MTNAPIRSATGEITLCGMAIDDRRYRGPKTGFSVRWRSPYPLRYDHPTYFVREPIVRADRPVGGVQKPDVRRPGKWRALTAATGKKKTKVSHTGGGTGEVSFF